MYKITWCDMMGGLMEVTIKNVDVVGDDAVVELTASANPLTIDSEDDDNVMSPVRGSTGTLTVMGHWQDHITVERDNQWRVTVWRNCGIEWIGWLKSEALDMSLSAEWEVVSYSLIDDVECMKGIEMPPSSEYVTLGRLIYEAVHAVMGDEMSLFSLYVDPSLPRQVGGDRLSLLSLRVSKGLWLDDDGEDTYSTPHGKTWYTVMSELCESLGMTLRSAGSGMVLCSATNIDDVTEELYWDEDLGDWAREGQIALDDEIGDWAGRHTISILPGVGRMKVTADGGGHGMEDMKLENDIFEPVRLEDPANLAPQWATPDNPEVMPSILKHYRSGEDAKIQQCIPEHYLPKNGSYFLEEEYWWTREKRDPGTGKDENDNTHIKRNLTGYLFMADYVWENGAHVNDKSVNYYYHYRELEDIGYNTYEKVKQNKEYYLGEILRRSVQPLGQARWADAQNGDSQTGYNASLARMFQKNVVFHKGDILKLNISANFLSGKVNGNGVVSPMKDSADPIFERDELMSLGEKSDWYHHSHCHESGYNALLMLRVGDKYWTGTKWSSERSYFLCEFKQEQDDWGKWQIERSEEQPTYITYCDGDGEIINVMQELVGELECCLLGFFYVYTGIMKAPVIIDYPLTAWTSVEFRAVPLTAVKKWSLSQIDRYETQAHSKKKESEQYAWTRDGYVHEEETAKCTITAEEMGGHAGALTDDDGNIVNRIDMPLDNVLHAGTGGECLLERMKDLRSGTSRAVTLEVTMTTHNVKGKRPVTWNGKRWWVLGHSDNYGEGTQKVRLWRKM